MLLIPGTFEKLIMIIGLDSKRSIGAGKEE
jgi:hypothetical protein